MGNCTPAEIHRQIASGKLDPVYLVLGEDDHEKAELASGFEQTIEEELRAFNVERFYGGEADLGTILSAARTLPMMASRRIVITFRADRVLQPKRDTAEAMRDTDAMMDFLEAQPTHVTLVLISGALDERRKLTKKIIARATVVQCGQLEDLSDAQRWIRARMKAAGKSIESEAVRLLAERSGPNAGRLRNEIDRLLLYAFDAREISVVDVMEVAGPAAAHDDWAVARAIERGSTSKALRELGLVLEGGAVPYMVLGQLAWVARTKMSNARVSAAISAVFRADVALKQSGGDSRILLERLVIELCGGMGSGRAVLGRR